MILESNQDKFKSSVLGLFEETKRSLRTLFKAWPVIVSKNIFTNFVWFLWQKFKLNKISTLKRCKNYKMNFD
jgi:magnesium-transporting ATPase (P-type)